MSASRTHKVDASAALPRASRLLTLSFGMFNVAVAIAPMFSEDKGLKGHLHCAEHHAGMKQAWYCEHGEHYVPKVELQTVYEYGGDNIVLSTSEAQALEAERDGVVKLTRSAQVSSIDPSYFEKSYLMWATPSKPNEQAYRALLTAMRTTGLALIGQVVISKTDRALVIRWSAEHGMLVAHVCNYGANLKVAAVETVRAAEFAWPEPTAEFVAQAELLLTSLESDFDPNAVEDTYQVRLEAALSAKATGGAVVPTPDAAPVPDMLAALKLEIEAANKS